MLKISRFLLALLFVLGFAGCGYQPSSQMVKKVFDESVFVTVDIDTIEPENAPYLTDELRRLIITRFDGKIAAKQEANNIIHVSYKGTKFMPLSYDKYGYVTRYQTTVKVDFTLKTKTGKIISKTITETVQEGTSDNAIHSSVLRTSSIKAGLAKAVDSFMAYISALGATE